MNILTIADCTDAAIDNIGRLHQQTAPCGGDTGQNQESIKGALGILIILHERALDHMVGHKLHIRT